MDPLAGDQIESTAGHYYTSEIEKHWQQCRSCGLWIRYEDGTRYGTVGGGLPRLLFVPRRDSDGSGAYRTVPSMIACA